MSIVAKYRLISDGNDTSGNNYNGTVTDVNFSNGYAEFNGSSSKVLLPNIDLIPITAGQAVTISFLMKPNTAQTGAKYEQPINLKEGLIFSYDHETSSFIGTFIFCNSAGAYYATQSTTINCNIFNYLACVYDGSDIYFYLNGVLKSSLNVPLAARRSINYNYIGTNSSASVFFNGALKEIIIDNTAWSQAKIKTMYMQYKGMF
jgi:hypothetical protein